MTDMNLFRKPSFVTTARQPIPQWEKTRVHNRFQGLITSVLDSANFSNFALTEGDPVESIRPSYEVCGNCCDLILQKRSGAPIACIEIKTKLMKNNTTIEQATDAVLRDCGEQIQKLQALATRFNTMWMVIIGIHQGSWSHAVDSWERRFNVIAVWGYDQSTNKARWAWSSLSSFDKGIREYNNWEDVFGRGSSKWRNSLKPKPIEKPVHDDNWLIEPEPIETDQQVVHDQINIEKLKSLFVYDSYKQALMMVYEHQCKLVEKKETLEKYSNQYMTHKSLDNALYNLIKLKIVDEVGGKGRFFRAYSFNDKAFENAMEYCLNRKKKKGDKKST